MNFYGHAWVAGCFSASEPFILGSMLPDLASMLRTAPPAARHEALGDGIRLHHDTDRVFHATDVFRSLESDARLDLANAGLPKGSRRALAHVGLELLIDAELARRTPAWPGYARALRFGGSPLCGERLDWVSAELRPRFAALCGRLADVADDGAESSRIARRLVAALAGRPRLELPPGHAIHLVPWLDTCRPRVTALLADLLAELARGLGAPAAPAAPPGPAAPTFSPPPPPAADSPAPARR